MNVTTLSLKRAREQAGLSAAEVARITSLSPRTISAIDEERYEELPAGIYARSSVRAYARALGRDPAEVLEALQSKLPEAPLDLLALAELRAPKRPAAYFRYALAAVVDAALLLSLLVTIVSVCSAFCALPPFRLLHNAPVAMAILCATPIALYFWLLGATGVPTVGPWLLDVEILPASEGPLSLDALFRRGLLYAGREIELAVRLRASVDAMRKSRNPA
ncbi:MAG: helix-turn-helix domain-containing protein [Betaproteobacteria bacterium]